MKAVSPPVSLQITAVTGEIVAVLVRLQLRVYRFVSSDSDITFACCVNVW